MVMNKRLSYLLTLVTVAALVVTMAGCGEDDKYEGLNLRPSSSLNNQGNNGQSNEENSEDEQRPSTPASTVEASGSLEDTVRMEVPVLKEGNYFVSHYTTEQGGLKVMSYCYEWDPTKNHTRWVAFRFDNVTRVKSANVGRTEAWDDDPDLPEQWHVGTATFKGYTRGHLCASADRQYSREANAQTFYMSNMSPQEYNFNAYYWGELESLVRNCGQNSSFADTLYVVKGGYIDNSSDLIGYVSRGNGLQVAIPGHYFMALLAYDKGSYSSIGFWVAHDSKGYNTYPPRSVLANDAVSIDRLEELTGIDFFHHLPDNIEKAVEATCDFNDWNR